MENFLVRKADEWAAKPLGIKAIVGRLASDWLTGPKNYAGHVPDLPATGNSHQGIQVHVDGAAKQYLSFRHYSRPVQFTLFSSEASKNMPGFDQEIKALKNGKTGLELVLDGNGFYATAHCEFEDNGYSLQVKNVRILNAGRQP